MANVTCPPPALRPFLTPTEIAAELRIDVNKPLDWINSGQLIASNVATRSGGRPRWRIRRENFEAFLKSRQLSPPVEPQKRRRKSSPRYY